MDDAFFQKIKEEESRYEKLCKEMLNEIEPEQMERIYSYAYCDIGFDFLGFLDVYEDLRELPKDFTILDMGCAYAIQGKYFENFAGYIGVDNDLSSEYRLWQKNGTHYECSIQSFIKDILPTLNLDLDKTFVICSYVPDRNAKDIITDTFPYYRCRYPGGFYGENNENYPDVFLEKKTGSKQACESQFATEEELCLN